MLSIAPAPPGWQRRANAGPRTPHALRDETGGPASAFAARTARLPATAEGEAPGRRLGDRTTEMPTCLTALR